MKTIRISDQQDTFAMKGTTYIVDLVDHHACCKQPSELAAFVALVSQMFYDHEDTFDEGATEQERQISEMFDQMRKIVGAVDPT